VVGIAVLLFNGCVAGKVDGKEVAMDALDSVGVILDADG
jgi:hypothetical protein